MTARRLHSNLRRLAPMLAAGAILAGALSLLRLVGWAYPVELLSHFQGQYAVVAVVGTVGLLLLGRYRLAAAAGVATACTVTAVLPYAWPGGGEAHAAAAGPPGRQVRVMLSNVLMSNRRHERLLDAVREHDPDLLVLQEVDERWMAGLESLGEAYPYRVVDPREDPFGMAVYSRLPLEDVRIPVIGEARRPTFVLTARLDGTSVTFVCTHPKQPLLRRTFQLRNDQLVNLAEITTPLEGPVVLVGDLNITMWSPWYARLERATGLANARRGRGVLPSWPAQLPPPMRIPIDHVMVSRHVQVRGCRLGPSVGSDHLPLIVDLTVGE